MQQLKQQLEGQLASARAGLQAQQAARLPAVDEDAEAHKHGLQEAAGKPTKWWNVCNRASKLALC